MQPFKIRILGCGSALPTLKHFASSQIIEVRDKTFMVDCGEGTQIQVRRARIHFNKIFAIFITHLHGDHCFGLIGLISTLGMLGRTAPLHIYAPKELGPILKLQMDFFCNGLEYEVTFHEVDTSVAGIVYEDKSVIVKSIPLNHRIACCGYMFSEKPTLPHIRRDMIDFYRIPECYRNNIKNGADWITPEGEVIPNNRLTEPAAAPRSYAYCSDTKYLPELYKLVYGVNLIYHEATYCSENENRASLYYHSTAKQAATVALNAKAKSLLLGHFSARYDNENAILNEARNIFPNTYLANEMSVFDVE
ncbi:ribonuclease Z [Marseilla massiliensis]|uniref:Ribonuclease Z n=1 Tax=Marseilla massiliensis TaxID=1841864 RepID=A0A938WRU0_9BACT|nr:ribonuclease Z [Marseilla massiliensis]MBM6672576.1 ribonuclease Z [Marseilla massiliensis]